MGIFESWFRREAEAKFPGSIVPAAIEFYGTKAIVGFRWFLQFP